MGLKTYRDKRRFERTPEPAGDHRALEAGRRYVVQKHAARRLHYDFRLEFGGVLKSWAVPKGPSLDPGTKVLAVHVEDHPLEYAGFEGVIPAGQYGGGTVMLWDRGTWQPEGDPAQAYRAGKLTFHLAGEKLSGRWTLVRMHGESSDGGKNWLLLKADDQQARPFNQFDVLAEMPRSVASGRTMEQIAAEADPVRTPSGKPASDQASNEIPAAKLDVGSLRGARRKRLPRTFSPQLAVPAAQTPVGDDWLHELKFDGYRLLCRIEDGRPQLLTRRGNDWTDRFPTVVTAVEALPWQEAILDGEVVVLAKDGTTNFQALQNLMRRGRDDDVVYFVFDLPFFEGFDLTAVELATRKQLLAELLGGQPPHGTIRYSDHIAGQGPDAFAHACRHALEGLVSKRAQSGYKQRRSRDWVKTKCRKRQEFIVVGWTEPSGSRQAFGSLQLAYYDDGRLVYCGRVGTGFNSQSLAQIKDELDQLVTNQPPFESPPAGVSDRRVHWVKPALVAEVGFASWTDDGVLRHASFQGLREDKAVDEVVREEPEQAASPQRNGAVAKTGPARNSKMNKSQSGARRRGAEVAGVPLTHPDRVLYPGQGITKLELAEFYESISDWVLPHIVGRPLTLVRCPKGRQGACFYQKHLTEAMPAPLRGVQVAQKDGQHTYVVVDDLAGLVSLVQMSVLELHPWPARDDRLDRPDRLVFDLDPDEGVAWSAIVQGARHVRGQLDRFELQSFVRTSGGKGLHVMVPLMRRTPWSELKQFAKSIAERLTAEHPERYVATPSKARRRGKIFIDYLRNQRGATAIASYSTRAKLGAPVATPIRWDELDARLAPDKYNVRNLKSRISLLARDPWDSFFDVRQTITQRMLRP